MDHTRHSNIFLIPTQFGVGLIGAGGIGSPTAIALAKMGVIFIDVFDDDNVDPVNIATQLHQVSDIGKNKAFALRSTAERYADGCLGNAIPVRVDGSPLNLSYSLIISAVDSIGARRDIFKSMQTSNFQTCDWYLDARMGAEKYQHFLVDWNNGACIRRYEEMLFEFDDADIPDAPCTEKATIYTAFMAAGQIGNVVKDIVTEKAVPHRLVHYIPQCEIQVFKL
jgi:ThiF family